MFCFSQDSFYLFDDFFTCFVTSLGLFLQVFFLCAVFKHLFISFHYCKIYPWASYAIYVIIKRCACVVLRRFAMYLLVMRFLAIRMKSAANNHYGALRGPMLINRFRWPPVIKFDSPEHVYIGVMLHDYIHVHIHLLIYMNIHISV